MKIEISDRFDIDEDWRVSTERQEKLYSAIRDFLDAHHVDVSLYKIGYPDAGTHGDLCIHLDGRLWTVYSSERGERGNPAFFLSGVDAANYFVWQLLDTSSVIDASAVKFPSIAFDPYA